MTEQPKMISGPPDYLCPLCRQPAHMVIGPTQALCSTEDCRVLIFNPSMPDGGMSDVQFIDTDGLVADQ